MKLPFKSLRIYREVARLNEPVNFKAIHTTHANTIEEAKRLHAKVYLFRNYITEKDLNKNKVLHKKADPYQDHSNYFVVRHHNAKTRTVVATARQIVATKHGHSSFPTMKELELYPEMRKAIEAVDPSKCVEISGLAKMHGVSSTATLTLYRTLWHHSLRRGHHIWLVACDAQVYKKLHFLFGKAFVRIGDNAFYMGSEVVPAMLEVHRSIDPLMQDSKSMNPFKRKMKRNLVKFFMQGLSVKYHTLQQNAALPSREIARAVEENRL